MAKLTEDQVINFLCTWLKNKGWKKLEMSTSYSRGLDLKVCKGRKVMIVEAKGSKANPKAYNKVRDKFDSGQINDHFGKAIVKVLEQRHQHPGWTVAIAQPNDSYIREHLQDATPEMSRIGIRLFWVESRKEVLTE